MFKHMFIMAVKTITVTESAYNALRNLKGEDESFSEVIIRVTKGKANIEKYFGVLKKEDAERIRGSIKEFRKKADKDYGERKRAVFG